MRQCGNFPVIYPNCRGVEVPLVDVCKWPIEDICFYLCFIKRFCQYVTVKPNTIFY